MEYILNIESTEQIASICLSNDEVCVDSVVVNGDMVGALTDTIDTLLKKHNIGSSSKLKAVAVSKGPGSFTGLRVGVSVAKGIAYSLNIPLIAVDTFSLLVHSFLTSKPDLVKGLLPNSVLCPVIQARKNEVYIQSFSLTTKSSVSEISVWNTLSQDERPWANGLTPIFFGSGVKGLDSLDDTKLGNVVISGDFARAEFMPPLVYAMFQNKEFVDVAYFEPFYIMEFVASAKKDKVIKTQPPA